MADLKLPTELHNILFQKQVFASDVISNLNKILHILEKSDLFFFPEYTDHSISHINGVLSSIENLITKDTLNMLSPIEIGILVTAVVLHDIGMFTNTDLFQNIIKGKYDNIPENWFKNEETWVELWQDYLKKSQYWNSQKRENVTGNPNYVVKATDKGIDEETDEETITYKISHPLLLNGEDKRFIGEFIRNYHPRLAYEIALKGYIGKTTCDFNSKALPRHFMQLSGLIARSHGINVRSTFDILKKKVGGTSWKTPQNIRVILLMALVRIADYLQIDPDRADPILLDIRTMYSKYSLKEHEMHRSIDCIQINNDDPELIVVQATPGDAQMYVKIEELIKDIQREFDLSWAILGEVYGNRYQLRYRRIISNIFDEEIKKDYTFEPKQFEIHFNSTLPKLLIAPLYGDDPSYGVRELVQNAVDACRARMAFDKDYNNLRDFTHVIVSIDSDNNLFRIVDTGIGMTIEEIEKYFLTIGSSYDNSIDWQKVRDDMNNKAKGDQYEVLNMIYRTGHFGIGILAAFLIGKTITVKTKSIKNKSSNIGYSFTLSLDSDVIQINRINLDHFGTIIEITCDDNTLQRFDNPFQDNQDSDFISKSWTLEWYEWYVDSKPKVDYFYSGKLIPQNSITGFDCFPAKTQGFGNIYWMPSVLFKSRPIKEYLCQFKKLSHRGKALLCCNGFVVSYNSNKKWFSIPGVESYFPPKIPHLMVTDIYNRLPLSLQRTQIDYMVEYDFEEELAIEILKDLLCQQVAIDFDKFEDLCLLFFHKSGYTYNRRPGELVHMYFDGYPEKCFQNKILVHFYGGNHEFSFNYHSWKPFFESHPNAFFTFYRNEPLLTDTESLLKTVYESERQTGLTGVMKHGAGLIVINTSKLSSIEGLRKEAINELRKKITKHTRKLFNNYRALGFNDCDLLNKPTKDIVNHINSLSDEEQPIAFVIHQNYNTNNQSSVLDSYVEKYFGGDIIVPYNETERKKQFAKLYKECNKKIELYREFVKDSDLEPVVHRLLYDK